MNDSKSKVRPRAQQITMFIIPCTSSIATNSMQHSGCCFLLGKL